MKTKNKTIALLEIAIVLCSLFLVATLPGLAADQTTQKVSTTTSEDDYVLDIYGNANEDDTIDMRDITFTARIILWLEDETYLADANYDGKISVGDMWQEGLIILGRESELTLIDMVNRVVTIKKPIDRVVTISDGLVESTMIVFGVEDKLVGLGSPCIGMDFEYTYETSDGSFTYYDGKNTAATLYPELKDLPVVAQYGAGISYETLAGLNPDIVILISGSCTCGCYETDETTQKAVEMIEELDIPLVVLSTPNCCDADIGAVYESIYILGGVFNRLSDANDLVSILEDEVEFVKDRTDDVPEAEKTRVLYIGLTTLYEGGATVGMVFGTDTMESIFLEEIVNAKNAFDDIGTPPMSAEQILALDPDVMMLPTWWGYHPAREVYEGKSLTDLQDMRVVQEERIYSLPWTPCRCGERLEFPIDLMIEGKACYPDMFSDVLVNEWVLDFYMEIYGVDEDIAEELRSAQWLDWMAEEDF